MVAPEGNFTIFTVEPTPNLTKSEGVVKEGHDYHIFGICNGVNTFMAVLGNAIIIITFMKNKKLRYFGNYFLMSLSITDFINGIFQAGKSISLRMVHIHYFIFIIHIVRGGGTQK